MPRITSSVGDKALEIIDVSLHTANNIGQLGIRADLDDLCKKANSIMSFISGYTLLDNAKIDTDDEIINWTTVDIIDDISSAIWNLSTGFYKTSASCQRGALEMASVSLYFQRLENEKPLQGSYNKAFLEWDAGIIPTPNWGTTLSLLKSHSLIKKFESENKFCIIDTAYDHFKYLCSFTHSRAFSPEDGKGTNSMNMLNQVGEYNEKEFKRIQNSLNITIAYIASIWAVTYPHIVSAWEEDNLGVKFVSLEDIFCTTQSKQALAFAKSNLNA